ncbi:MAG: hypothetical protein R3F62_10370 [Planctomycetota bacterium]
MHYRSVLTLTALCALPLAQAQTKEELKRDIVELKERLERAARWRTSDEAVHQEKLREASQQVERERERIADYSRMVDTLHKQREADMRREAERLAREEEWRVSVDEERRWLENQVRSRAAANAALVKALIANHAVLRAKGLEVPGETEARRKLALPFGIELQAPRSLGEVLGELSEKLGLEVAFLDDELTGFPIGALSVKPAPVTELLDAIVGAVYGTERKVRWRVEGAYLVIEEVR